MVSKRKLVIFSASILSVLAIGKIEEVDAHTKCPVFGVETCAHTHSIPAPRTPAPQGLTICNNSDIEPLFIAYVTGGRVRTNLGILSDSYTSKGWTSVSRGDCEMVYSENAGDIHALRAENRAGSRWYGRDREFCVNHDDDFTYPSSANSDDHNCDQAGGSWARYSLVEFSRQQTYTYH